MIVWLLMVLGALAGPLSLPADQVDSAGVDALFQGQRLALLVGPGAFEDGSFTPLRYTDDDAFALAEVLADADRGHFDRVWTLTTPAETELASVRAVMAEIAAQVLARRRRLRLLLDPRHPGAPRGRTAAAVSGAGRHAD
jgi:hypothetical protein